MSAIEAPYGDPAITLVHEFEHIRDAVGPTDRLRSARKAAEAARERMLSASPVRFYRSLDLIRVPYPTRFALREACTAKSPVLHIFNRMFVVQVDTDHGLRTVLVSPSDIDANSETPFFRRLTKRMGRLEPHLSPLLAPRSATVEKALSMTGIRPEQVDYITYDHLHTQDVRRWLGSTEHPGIFPNAKLLVRRQEWQSAHALLPPQRDWYCPDGLLGIPEERVVLLDHDVSIGSALSLIHTPGHTEGNHSIAVRTPEGIMVTSENGVGPDAYAPVHSQVPGLQQYARDTGMEVVINGNTMEGGLDQYISMVLEKTLAGPSARHPDFPNMVCSSEFTAYWAFPGLKPTFAFGPLSFGESVRG